MLRASYPQRRPDNFFSIFGKCLDLTKVVALAELAAIAFHCSSVCFNTSVSHVHCSFQKSLIKSLALNVDGTVHSETVKKCPKLDENVSFCPNGSLVLLDQLQ